MKQPVGLTTKGMEHTRKTMVMKIISQNIWISAAEVTDDSRGKRRRDPPCSHDSVLTIPVLWFIPTSDLHTAKLQRTVTAISTSITPPYKKE